MGEFTSFISGSSNVGGSIPRSEVTPTSAEPNPLAGVVQLAQAGLNIFGVAKQSQAKAAQSKAAEMANDLVQQTNDAMQGGNAIAARNNIAKQYSSTLAGFEDQEAAEVFRSTYLAGAGFNPVTQVASAEIQAEQQAMVAKQNTINEGFDYAVGTLGMSQEAFAALPQDEQIYHGRQAMALTESMTREKSLLDLEAARGAKADRIQKKATGAAARIAGELASQRITGVMSEWQLAVDSGDPALIAQVQTDLQAKIAGFKANTSQEVLSGLTQLGYINTSDADVQAQTTAIQARYTAVEGVFKSSNFVTANKDAQVAAVLMANNSMLTGQDEEEKRVASSVAIDMALGGQGTIVTALNINSVLTDNVTKALNTSGSSDDPTKVTTQLVQNSLIAGPASALANSQGSSPEVNKEVSKVWGDSIKTVALSGKPEQVSLVASGIGNTINSALTGRGGERRVALDSFPNMLDSLSDAKVGKTYAQHMVGTEQQMGAYMSEFIVSDLTPSTARMVSVQDLKDYTLEFTENGMRVIPPKREQGTFDEFNAMGDAVLNANVVNTVRNFSKPIQVLEKMSLMANNLYNIPTQATRQAMATRWAQQLGMKISGLPEQGE